MRRARISRRALWAIVAVWAGSVGCHTHYHYAGVPVCPPSGEPVVSQSAGYGAVCEVPGTNGGATIVSNAGPAPSSNVTAGNSTRSSRVVLSEPASGSVIRSSSRLGWRRSDPENLATIKVDGALDETINR